MKIGHAMFAVVIVALAATTACLRAQGWVRHNDPLGFTVQHPAGWKVETDAAGLIRVGAADRSAFILVQPFLLPRPTTARQWVQQAPAALAGAFPQSRVTRVEQRGARPDQVLASLAYAPAGQATLLCLIDGKAGMVYAIAAPQAQFAARRPELVRILRTFSFTQPSTRARPGSGPALQYVRWSDPLENAFSIEVPARWRASGGMSRFAPVDTRAAVDLVSPDGQVHVMFGDASLPTHTEPTQTLAMAGFREGSWYSPGYGVRMMVRRYLPGVYFAAEYAQRRVGQQCTGLTLVDRRDRPDLAAQLGRIYVQTGYVSQQLTTGEVSFTCSAGGAPMRGYYFAGTLRVGTGGSGIWQVPHLVGWLAPPDRVGEAQAVLQHVIATAQINPDWARMQQGIAANSSEIVSRTHAEITRIIDDTYWNRQRSQDNLSRQWSNVILGQTDVRDPETGETWKVASGHNYYWRKEYTDGIAGTDTYARPDIDFTPLVEW